MKINQTFKIQTSMKIKQLFTFLSFFYALTLAAQLPPPYIQTTFQTEIDAVRDAFLQQNNILIPGIIVKMEKVGQWTQTWTSGSAIATGQQTLLGDEKFRIGLNSEMFVAVAIMKMVDNNQITLSDPITTWLPPAITVLIPNAATMTVKNLLQHNSNIAEYYYVQTVNGVPVASPLSIDYLTSNYLNYYTFNTIMNNWFDGSLSSGLPGSNLAFTGTDYLLLGEIIKNCTGQSWQQYITQNIIQPLNLANTSCIADNEITIPANFLNAYGQPGDPSIVPPVLFDNLVQNFSVYGAASGVISNVGDLITFWKAVRNGQVLSATSTTLLQTCDVFQDNDPTASAGVGLGCLEQNQDRKWIGTELQGSNQQSAVYYFKTLNAYVSVAVNTDLLPPSIPISLLQQIIELYESTLSTNTYSQKDFSLFPNPVLDSFTIGYKENNTAQIKILDLTGRVVRQIDNSTFNAPINVAGLQKGTYLVEILSDGQKIVKEIVKE